MLLWMTLACGSKDCSTKSGDERNWCYYDRAVEAAQRDDLDGAVAHVGSIDDPVVASAATKRIIQESPLRLDQAGAERLCTQLDTKGAESCLREWKRPHLWGE